MNFLPFLLGIVGIALVAMGRLSIGFVHQEGRHVRIAGGILLTPFLLTLVLNLSRAATAEQNETLYYTQQGWINVMDMLASLIAFGAAYIVLMRIPIRALRPRWNVPPPPVEEEFPRFMDVAQAARYLKISEHDILNLIDEGSIAAQRDGDGFTISRAALDEFERKEMN
jgi:excisionase family DNA binding protein